MIDPALTAVVDFTSAVRRHNARSGSSGHGWLLAAVVAGIALFWIALYYWDRSRKQRKHQLESSSSLFAELCTARQLGRNERAILTQAARTNHLEEPALLFVDPVLFERTLNAVATDPDQIETLAEQLFGRSSSKTTGDVTTA